MKQVMIFDGVLSGCMYSNTRYAVYNGWKVVMLYSRDFCGGH